MTKQQAILLLFVLIIIGGGATIYMKLPSSQPSLPAAEATQNPAASGSTSGTTASTNKTIIETHSYTVPNGNTEDITVACVVDANGMVVDVTFSFGTPTNPESREYLGKFNKAFSSSLLVGSKVGDKKLSRLGGASLTTKAFNEALGALAVKVGA